MVKNGIDISHHQSRIDFDSVKRSGIDFVIIREGYGTNTDRWFFENVRMARKSELDIFGIYHFCYSTNEDEVKEEVESCIRNLVRAGIDQNVICFFDFEYDTINKASNRGVVLTKYDCINFTSIFCEEMKSEGWVPGIYANIDFVNNYYSWDLLDKYPLWLADYTENPMYDCLVHQYTSSGSIPGIQGSVDLNYLYIKDINEELKPVRTRYSVVDLVRSWIGKNEKDGSYKQIIDLYNSYPGKLPRGIKMEYSWPWCACTWSALAIGLEYTDIMPIEISCGYLIEKAKEMRIWVEDDGHCPEPGDGVLYDWDDTGVGDNEGWPDHIGIVDYSNPESGYFTAVEGNYSNSVKKRTIDINGKFIRGFITPRYNDEYKVPTETSGKDFMTVAREVICGVWGNGEARKKALQASGYDPEAIQKIVNDILNKPAENKPSANVTKIECTAYASVYDDKVNGFYRTTDDLYCRNGAGSNKKALTVFPKGTDVRCYGYYTPFNGTKWLLVVGTKGRTEYTGFCSEKYLERCIDN